MGPTVRRPVLPAKANTRVVLLAIWTKAWTGMAWPWGRNERMTASRRMPPPIPTMPEMVEVRNAASNRTTSSTLIGLIPSPAGLVASEQAGLSAAKGYNPL
jgi:hypothetical protein